MEIDEGSILAGSSLDTFIRNVRSSIEESSTMSELLRRVALSMRTALQDPDLTEGGSGVVYRDPTYLFQIDAGVQKPGSQNSPHDHGECWAVYGISSGVLRMTRYERLDDGSDGDFGELRPLGAFDCHAGEADIIAPWGIHQLANCTDEPVHTFVIRSRNLADVWRNRFDVEARKVERIHQARSSD